MRNTRFMQVMFSNTDEELAKQVDSDIKRAAGGDEVDTEELKYERTPDGNVAITDNENGEVTIAEKDPNEKDTYNLVAVPDGQLERYVHPSEIGLKNDSMVGAPDEFVGNHFGDGCVINPEMADGGLNPEAGHERRVTELMPSDDTREFSIVSENDAWQKIFSMPQEFIDYLFSEVIESSETSKVGDLKVEKCAEDDDSVVVTSEATGDQVKVTLNDKNMEVTELDSKNFSDEEGQYLPYILIGIHPYDHYLVEAQEYGIERAQALKAKLEEDGIESVEIFDDQDKARDYVDGLLEQVGADPENGDVDEAVEEKEYSESIGATRIFSAPYRTEDTVFMSRLYSENSLGISDTHEEIEDAIEDGEVKDIDGATVTPINDTTAVIEEGDEYTKAIVNGEDLILKNIEEEEAEDLKDSSDIEDNDNEEEHDYSDVLTNLDGTRYFSQYEEMTDYMQRLFSEEADQDEVEDAIESGEEIENDKETITPVDKKTAVIEDKETGEFTRATITDEDQMNVTKIDEDEAKDLVSNIVVESEDDDDDDDDEDVEDEDEEDDEEERDYSDLYMNPDGTKYFSLYEDMTDYMQKLYTDEEDQDDIEDAIESGEQVEDDDKVITPIDKKTAVIEDKETGEFTKAEIDEDNNTIDVDPISEDEADDLTDNIAVQKSDEEQEEDEIRDEVEKKYSAMGKFFAEVMASQQPAMPQQPVQAQQPLVAPSQQGMVDPNQEQMMEEQPSVEEIEDKALAAVQSIKAAAEEATSQIMDAKSAPAEVAEPEIQEAQFSEKTFSQDENLEQLVSWLNYK